MEAVNHTAISGQHVTSRIPPLTVLANVTIELFALACGTVQNGTRAWMGSR